MEAFNFLLHFVFDTYLMVLILRVWLQQVRADFYNPLSQFIVKVTNPVVVPMRRIIPGLGGLDVATIVLAYLVACSKFVIIGLLNNGGLAVADIIIIGGLSLLKQTGFLLFFIMLIMALMSWVVQGYNPNMVIFQQLTEPFLRPIRSILPAIGGIDLSVLVAFVILNLLNIMFSGWFPVWRML